MGPKWETLLYLAIVRVIQFLVKRYSQNILNWLRRLVLETLSNLEEK